MPEFRRNTCQIRGSEFEHQVRPGILKVILTFKIDGNGNEIEYPFLWKKTKLDSKRTLSIYLRATIDGQRFEVSTQRYIEVSKWSIEAGKMKGNETEGLCLPKKYRSGWASFLERNTSPKMVWD